MAGTKDRVTIELYVDDQGTIKIRQAKVATEELAQAGKQGFADSSSAADDFASSLVKQLGIYALVTAAAWKLEQAVVGAFKAGIKTLDDYKVGVIGIAATLTDMAKPGQGDLTEIFERNMAAGEGMYRAINVEAAKHFAGVHEGMMVYNRLVQSGYAVRLDEVGALMTLADKIKLATQGQNQEVQLNQEVRALMDGQARSYSMLAMELQSRLGPGWADLLEKHKEAGDLLQWLTSLWPGLQVATGKVTETLTSQKTTLKSILDLIAIDGLGGAYRDIVNYTKEINQYLREHREEIASGVATAWEVVRTTIHGAYDSVKGIKEIASEIIHVEVEVGVQFIGPAGEWLANYVQGQPGFKQYYGETQGAWRNLPGGPGDANRVEPSFDAEIKRIQARWDALSGMQIGRPKAPSPLGQADLGDLTLPGLYDLPKRPVDLLNRRKDEAGGGTGLEAEARRLMSLYDTMTKDIARLSEGSVAEIDANLAKTIDQIYSRQEQKAVTEAELEVLARQRAALQKEKVESDFWNKIAAESGDAFAKLNRSYEEDLRKYSGIAGAKEAIEATWRKGVYEADFKQQQDLAGLQKTSLDNLAGALPLLNQQLPLKRLALDLELQAGKATLEHKIYEMEITDEARKRVGLAPLLTEDLKEQLRAEQALFAQVKKTNLEMENNKGLAGWAYGRQKEIDQRNDLKDILGGAESWLGDTFGKSALDTMKHEKKNFQKLWQDIMSDAMLWAFKHSARTLFDTGPRLLGQQGQGAGGVGGQRGGGDPYGLTQAGESLQKAGLGFNLNTAQFGLAAGGLLLSGIGIMTNSQALVVAGMVLQLAAVAIQIYQMLASTSAATSLIGAAAALTGAAAALTAAAGARAVLHSGGIMAHQGLLVAHGGLNTDERLVKVLTGEPILQRSAWAAYQRMGLSFEDLNNGRLPAVPVPVGNFTTPRAQAPGPGAIQIDKIHVQVDARGADKDIDWDHIARKKIIPAIERDLARKGVKLGK